MCQCDIALLERDSICIYGGIDVYGVRPGSVAASRERRCRTVSKCCSSSATCRVGGPFRLAPATAGAAGPGRRTIVVPNIGGRRSCGCRKRKIIQAEALRTGPGGVEIPPEIEV